VLTFDAEANRVALAKPSAIGTALFRITVVPGVVHAVAPSGAGRTWEAAAGWTGRALTFAGVICCDPRRMRIAAVRVRVAVTSADGVEDIRASLRPWPTDPVEPFTRATAEDVPAELPIATLQVAGAGTPASARK
jgi:hypothetical protein